MNFLDLFAGIGGFRLGMERAGHECVGYVEIDKFARMSYQAIHDTEGEWTREDITKVTDDEWRTLRGTVDIICGGFPCQSFSIAGKRLGFEETRGTLFFEIARAAKQIQPRYLFLENVKGLLSHNKGETFATILTALHELGYDAEWQILNSKDFGVPQNRERVFIIGHLRGAGGREIFPLAEASRTADESRVIANTLTARYPYSQREGTYIETTRKSEQVMPVLTPDRIIKRQNGRRLKTPGEPAFTLTAQDQHGIIVFGELEGSRREQSNRIYSEKGLAPTLTTMQGGGQEPKIAIVENVNPSKRGMNGEVYSSEGLAPTLTTNKGEGQKVAIIQKARGYNKGGKHDIAPTLSSSSWQENNLLQEGNFRIRKLTPRECWRLQGFPDWAFDRAAEVNSNSQLYKQSGNSVTENVIWKIAKLFKEEKA
ncbi:TPA: DNA (cytosine-5-)-methyltransferase [Listeria monocytogenes]|nr:DNA (cytosine-5-)-methyltransferase [Listeria monocytogenes]HAA0195412.1 DNA (cytosine-5-)-methyltransferase [Listeria monocytogenes]HAA0242868.1 DNA (cytosine-5-)-methyltransferase [Listeria monocytogenes]HAA0317402.1 DNA (cytosine-5-)-methyltransferase [Listeria monocytogenes]HAA0443423.1 DNA (cytosine-5-)-methyltransferase [Listeria monocytogenes]